MSPVPIIANLDLKYSIIERFIPSGQKILFTKNIPDGYLEFFTREKQALCKKIDNDQNLTFDMLKYKTEEFDYVIIDGQLDCIRNPGLFLQQTLKISKNIILFFENQASLSDRLKFLFQGTLYNQERERSRNLSFWQEILSFNLSYKDLINIFQDHEILLEKGLFYNKSNIYNIFNINNNPNLFGKNFILKLKKNSENKILEYNLSEKISFI